MSLLLNEDFSTYQLRLAYLHHNHDGVGERLINLDTATGVLNNPAFRAAGWLPDTAAIKRCYSPPIPTTGAGVSNEYFQVPRKYTGVNLEDDGGDGGGMVTGNQGSEDTIGVGGINERKRRRTRKEQLEEDDSSDLSDESDEDEKTAAQGIKFSKMPIRDRSKSSPPPSSMLREDGTRPELMVTSPSRPPEAVGQGLRRGSLGQVEAIKQRARRDTTTSSDMSSDNELDPNAFSRKLPGRPGAKKSVHLAERIQEEERAPEVEAEAADSDLEDEDVGEASDLSDEFEVDASAATGESPELLGIVGVGRGSEDTSPIKALRDIPPPVLPGQNDGSPRKPTLKDNLLNLPRLPPGRPISRVAPNSLITMALKGTNGSTSGEKPFQRFADLSGKGEANPLWIKIYYPFSKTPTDPIEIPLRRMKEGNPVTVTELIGLALWRYNEEDYEPSLESEEDTSVNRWTLRIVEDEEVDFDFPALVRTRPVTDFTSNNNRPPQRRARDKPWDEFGLVRATGDQFKENEELTPQIGQTNTSPMPGAFPGTPQPPDETQMRPLPAQRLDSEVTIQSIKSGPPPSGFNPARNPITGPSFAPSALRKETGSLLDLPQRDNPQSTPRTGAPKTVNMQYTDPQTFTSTNVKLETTADTYIAELFDQGCRKLNIPDKGSYVLKVHGTQTVAPNDRTVEALGDRLHLDLVRRRFMGAGAGEGMFGLGLSGSPGSSSPNAPLELTTSSTPPGVSGAPGRRKKAPFASQPKANASTLNFGLGLALAGTSGLDVGGKRFNVLRKQPLSFAPSHPRTLIITPEYIQILPAAPDSLAAPTGKVTNVPMTSVIGVKVSRKHPKMVRVLVYREKEPKRYDFECSNNQEAVEIVSDVQKGLDAARDEGDI